ncbi:MAG: phosphotransferase, partial [Candidatus Omnitrophica bacterium]|nr:phosphotransferase [Candidatus Omnitrophota bacterium]
QDRKQAGARLKTVLRNLAAKYEIAEFYREYGASLMELTNLGFFPNQGHHGNQAIDLLPSGQRIWRWYDLGGWRIAGDLTREQQFGCRYYVMLSGVTVTLRDLIQSPGLQLLKDMGIMHPVYEFLEGFFHRHLDHPLLDFDELTFDDYGRTNIEAALLTPGVPAIHLQKDAPFARLLRALYGFPQAGPEKRSEFRIKKGEQSYRSEARFFENFIGRGSLVGALAGLIAAAGSWVILPSAGVAWSFMKTIGVISGFVGTFFFLGQGMDQIHYAWKVQGCLEFNQLYAAGSYKYVFENERILPGEVILVYRGRQALAQQSRFSVEGPKNTEAEEEEIYRELIKHQMVPETRYIGRIPLHKIVIPLESEKKKFTERFLNDQKLRESVSVYTQEKGIPLSRYAKINSIDEAKVYGWLAEFSWRLWRLGFIDLDVSPKNYLVKLRDGKVVHDSQGRPVILLHDFGSVFRLPPYAGLMSRFFDYRGRFDVSRGILLISNLVQLRKEETEGRVRYRVDTESRGSLLKRILFPEVDLGGVAEILCQANNLVLGLPPEEGKTKSLEVLNQESNQAVFRQALQAIGSGIDFVRYGISPRSEVRTNQPDVHRGGVHRDGRDRIHAQRQAGGDVGNKGMGIEHILAAELRMSGVSVLPRKRFQGEESSRDLSQSEPVPMAEDRRRSEVRNMEIDLMVLSAAVSEGKWDREHQTLLNEIVDRTAEFETSKAIEVMHFLANLAAKPAVLLDARVELLMAVQQIDEWVAREIAEERGSWTAQIADVQKLLLTNLEKLSRGKNKPHHELVAFLNRRMDVQLWLEDLEDSESPEGRRASAVLAAYDLQVIRDTAGQVSQLLVSGGITAPEILQVLSDIHTKGKFPRRDAAGPLRESLVELAQTVPALKKIDTLSWLLRHLSDLALQQKGAGKGFGKTEKGRGNRSEARDEMPEHESRQRVMRETQLKAGETYVWNERYGTGIYLGGHVHDPQSRIRVRFYSSNGESHEEEFGQFSIGQPPDYHGSNPLYLATPKDTEALLSLLEEIEHVGMPGSARRFQLARTAQEFVENRSYLHHPFIDEHSYGILVQAANPSLALDRRNLMDMEMLVHRFKSYTEERAQGFFTVENASPVERIILVEMLPVFGVPHPGVPEKKFEDFGVSAKKFLKQFGLHEEECTFRINRHLDEDHRLTDEFIREIIAQIKQGLSKSHAHRWNWPRKWWSGDKIEEWVWDAVPRVEVILKNTFDRARIQPRTVRSEMRIVTRSKVQKLEGFTGHERTPFEPSKPLNPLTRNFRSESREEIRATADLSITDNVKMLAELMAREFGIRDVTGIGMIAGGAGWKSQAIPVLMTPSGDFAIKSLKRVEGELDAQFVHGYARHLIARGIPIMSVPKRNTEGLKPGDYYTVFRFSESEPYRYYALDRWAEGREISRRDATPSSFRAVGRMLGKIHNHSRDFDLRDDKDPRIQMDRVPQHYSFKYALDCILKPDAEWYRTTAAVMTGEDRALVDSVIEQTRNFWTPERLDKLVYHAIMSDFNFANLKFDEAGENVTAVFDLDNARRGYRIEDFFPPLIHAGRPGETVYTENLAGNLRFLLEGYNQTSLYELTQDEREALPHLMDVVALFGVVFFALRANELGGASNEKFSEVLRERIQIFKDITSQTGFINKDFWSELSGRSEVRVNKSSMKQVEAPRLEEPLNSFSPAAWDRPPAVPIKPTVPRAEVESEGLGAFKTGTLLNISALDLPFLAGSRVALSTAMDVVGPRGNPYPLLGGIGTMGIGPIRHEFSFFLTKFVRESAFGGRTSEEITQAAEFLEDASRDGIGLEPQVKANTTQKPAIIQVVLSALDARDCDLIRPRLANLSPGSVVIAYADRGAREGEDILGPLMKDFPRLHYLRKTYLGILETEDLRRALADASKTYG